MAHQEDPDSSVAPYPGTPSYLWKEFTEDKCARIQRLRTDKNAQTILDVPDDLAFLQPPPPPPDGQWRLFGQLHSLGDRLPSLEDHGIERLGPVVPATSTDKDAHATKVFALKKLSKSLLLNFLELTGILSTNPHDATAKLADLQTIFYNMHQQVNEWRPHQTREALIALLQSQLEKTRNETRALQETTDNVRRTLVGCAHIADPLRARDGVEGAETQEQPAQARASELWAAMDEIFG